MTSDELFVTNRACFEVYRYEGAEKSGQASEMGNGR